jgi:hypothetical protein
LQEAVNCLELHSHPVCPPPLLPEAGGDPSLSLVISTFHKLFNPYAGKDDRTVNGCYNLSEVSGIKEFFE